MSAVEDKRQVGQAVAEGRPQVARAGQEDIDQEASVEVGTHQAYQPSVEEGIDPEEADQACPVEDLLAKDDAQLAPLSVTNTCTHHRRRHNAWRVTAWWGHSL